jgi:5-oxopent-3-ene-1,2,5-tricarboxylate decarboxylase / 2-hydroxyhepta-2,4-diene-1,7-dioate isomerase
VAGLALDTAVSLPSTPPAAHTAARLDSPPQRPSGTVYGCLLNHAPALAALGDAVHQPPYKAPPRAPVLYVKPRNTRAGDGEAVLVPADVPGLQVGAALGLVIGRTACRVTLADALAHVAGVVIVNDLSLPHDSFYRPSVRLKARDGFCPVGDTVLPLAELPAPVDTLGVRVLLDGVLVHSTTTGDRIRGAAQLLADVSEFMTLQPGDVLMLGVSQGAPLARAGQVVVVEIDGLGRLHTPLVAEAEADRVGGAGPGDAAPAAMARMPTRRSAQVAYGGAVHGATPHPQGLRLDDGRVLAEADVVWLPPFEVGTIIALGLNYADHVKELSKELTISTQDEPLVFLKGPGSLIGHRGRTRRPAGAAFMHYECELAVVIGRTARGVQAADAMAYVAGYTVCNDYAVRDYLENWYRPNLRVKNRDGGTVLGPWFVPASELPDPHALGLRTRVNGQLTQQGSTADMINTVPALIEYLSGFMTLQPGDVILTGTPDGVVNVNVGDEVVCEIDGVGRQLNTLAADTDFGR